MSTNNPITPKEIREVVTHRPGWGTRRLREVLTEASDALEAANARIADYQSAVQSRDESLNVQDTEAAMLRQNVAALRAELAAEKKRHDETIAGWTKDHNQLLKWMARCAERDEQITQLNAAMSDLGDECHELRERAEAAEARLKNATEAWGCEIGPKPGDALRLVATGTKYEMQNMAMAAECNARAVPVLVIPQEPR